MIKVYNGDIDEALKRLKSQSYGRTRVFREKMYFTSKAQKRREAARQGKRKKQKFL